MTGQPFKLLRDIESARHHRILVTIGLQFRLACDCRRQRHGRCGVLRHQFAQLVDLPVGHLQHASDIAQHAPRLQRTESDDLRHLVPAVALLYILDHFAAPLLAKIDIEVRHRHAFRVEKALEQQAEPNWIEIGDGECVGDQ